METWSWVAGTNSMGPYLDMGNIIGLAHVVTGFEKLKPHHEVELMEEQLLRCTNIFDTGNSMKAAHSRHSTLTQRQMAEGKATYADI